MNQDKIILVSNDDGINAPGIRVLCQHLAQVYKIYVVAPDRQRSASAHSLTLHKPLRVDKYHGFNESIDAWYTNGTPCDCIKLAFNKILDIKPDFVISGINNGANIGSEIFYSGTVAAAREGSLMGIPSIAVSLYSQSKSKNFDTAAKFIVDFIKLLIDKPHNEYFKYTKLININVPDIEYEKIQGVAITRPGVRQYDDYYETRTDPRGDNYYWLDGKIAGYSESEDTDVVALLQNKISVSPITLNLACNKSLGLFKDEIKYTFKI